LGVSECIVKLVYINALGWDNRLVQINLLPPPDASSMAVDGLNDRRGIKDQKTLTIYVS
jgi:hypothetical protein